MHSGSEAEVQCVSELLDRSQRLLSRAEKESSRRVRYEEGQREEAAAPLLPPWAIMMLNTASMRDIDIERTDWNGLERQSRLTTSVEALF